MWLWYIAIADITSCLKGFIYFITLRLIFISRKKNARKKASVDLMANACDRRKQVTVGLFHSWVNTVY